MEHTCRRVRKWMSEFLDGELDERHREEVMTHLTACEKCHAEMETLERTVKMVRDVGEVDPPPFLLERVRARLASEKKRQPSFLHVLEQPYVRVAIAAGILLLLCFYGFMEVPRLGRVRGETALGERSGKRDSNMEQLGALEQDALVDKSKSSRPGTAMAGAERPSAVADTDRTRSATFDAVAAAPTAMVAAESVREAGAVERVADKNGPEKNQVAAKRDKEVPVPETDRPGDTLVRPEEQIVPTPRPELSPTRPSPAPVPSISAPAGGGEVPERIASKSGEMAVDASSGRNGVAGKPSLEATRGRAPNVPDTPLRAMGKVPEGAGRTKFGAAGETARRQQGEEVRLMKKAETSRHASGVTIQVANIGTATVEEILQKYGATRCEQAEAAEEGLVAASQRQKLVKANREVEEIWVACPARNLDVFLADLTRLGAAVTTGPEMPTVSTLPQTAVGESSATAGGNTGVVFVRILLTGQNPKK